ncbi:MAG: hypothetical protein H3C68_01310 [Deltaproteobacteria bacterium]|nr:hypothetical protein [Deltaproteobacteria bacterium]MBZ0219108.1 hypothetical protein [Deltaproteobacteria bacterium]
MGGAGLPEVSPAEKERAVSELRTVRITERPGRSRLERVHGIVDAYTNRVLGMVEARLEGVRGEKEEYLREGVKRLNALRFDELTRLRGTLAIEEPSNGRRPELPFSFDPTPPHERPSPPDGPPGILYR